MEDISPLYAQFLRIARCVSEVSSDVGGIGQRVVLIRRHIYTHIQPIRTEKKVIFSGKKYTKSVLILLTSRTNWLPGWFLYHTLHWRSSAQWQLATRSPTHRQIAGCLRQVLIAGGQLRQRPWTVRWIGFVMLWFPLSSDPHSVHSPFSTEFLTGIEIYKIWNNLNRMEKKLLIVRFSKPSPLHD